MSFSQRIVGAGLVLVLFLTAAGLRAQDEAEERQKKLDAYASKLAHAEQTAAKEHADVASYCEKIRLFEQAGRHYEAAIALDPDHSTSRRKLGYKKKDGVWVKDEKRAIPERNQIPEESLYEALEVYRKKRDTEIAKAAKEFVKIGEWCERVGLAEEARTAFRRALSFDGESAKAREALGYSRVGDIWVSAERSAVRETLAKAMQDASPGTKPAAPGPIVTALGFPMECRETKHFRIHTVFDAEFTEHLARRAEVLYEDFRTVFDLPANRDLIAGTIDVVVVRTEEEHHKAWDVLHPEDPPDERDYDKRHYGGSLGYDPPYIENYSRETGEDRLVHCGAHILANTVDAGYGKAWIYEGIAFLLAGRHIDHTEVYCAGQEQAGGAARALNDPHQWEHFVRGQVERGTDADIFKVLQTEEASSLRGAEVLKGWSILRFLMEKDLALFKSFLGKTRRHPDQEKLLREVYNWDYAELDAAWRQYVLERY